MRIASDQAGERLDAVLADRLGSRSRAARLIDEGRVTVDGARVAKRHRVKEGELIEVDEPVEPRAPEQVDVPFAVAYEETFEDMPRRVPATEKIERAIGWRPELDLDCILESVIEYARERQLATA